MKDEGQILPDRQTLLQGLVQEWVEAKVHGLWSTIIDEHPQHHFEAVAVDALFMVREAHQSPPQQVLPLRPA